MIDEEKLAGAVEIILENILTPVIYMYVDEVVEFVCFSDMNTEDNAFRSAEESIYKNYGISAEVVDFREFDVADRCDIINDAELVYAMDDLVKMLVETALYADSKAIMEAKSETIDRKRDTGTYYLN